MNSDNFSTNLSSVVQCVHARDYLAKYEDDKIAKLEFQFLFGFVYSTIFVLGVVGNVLVIASVYREKGLHTVRNFFIVSLSLSDTLVCFTSVPITPLTSVFKIWLFGSVMCKLFPLFQCTSIFVSTFTLAAIALDRYILIVHPARPPITFNQAIKIIFGIWIIAVATGMPIAAESSVNPVTMPQGDEIHDNRSENTVTLCGEFCSEQWGADTRMAYGTVVLLLQFVVPFFVITFSYAKIFQVLAKSQVANRKLTINVPVEEMSAAQFACRNKQKSRRRNRTTKMLISMVALFTVCWLPQVTVNILNDFGLIPEYIISQHVYGLTFHAIAMTSTCWNPMLYAGMNENFRFAFLLLLPKYCRRCCGVTDLDIKRPNFDSATTIVRNSNSRSSSTPGNERQKLLTVPLCNEYATRNEINSFSVASL